MVYFSTFVCSVAHVMRRTTFPKSYSLCVVESNIHLGFLEIADNSSNNDIRSKVC